MAKPGRRRRTPNAQELLAAVEEYHAQCEEKRVFPDYAGLRARLGLSEEAIAAACEDDAAVAAVFEHARDLRESFLARGAVTVATGCAAALRQPENGGWADKESGGGRVVVILEGFDARKAGE